MGYNCSSLPKLPLKVAHEWIIPVSPPVKYECDSLAQTDILAIDEITQHIVYDYLTPTNGYMSEYRCERLLTIKGCHTFWTMPSICRIVCSYQSSRCAQKGAGHGPLARYLKLRVAHVPGIPGTFSPPPRVSNPDMHHGTCVTHVSWCMP